MVGAKLDRPAKSASSPDAPTSTVLSGRRLLLARVGWLVVAALTVGLFFASIPARYDWLVNFGAPELEPATVRANLEATGFSIDFYATYLLSVNVISSMVWGVVGVVIFWRRSDDWMALATSLCLLTFGLFTSDEGSAALAAQYPDTGLPIHLLAFFGSVSLVLFFYLFPRGRFVPRWTRWMAIFWTAHEVAYYFFPDSSFNIGRSLPLLDFVAFSIFVCTAIGSQLYRYRRVSGPVERQQTKWVVFGTMAAGLGTVGFALPLYASPTLVQFGSPYTFAIQTGISISWLLIPLSIGVAILRHRLWDIDIIINRTLVYGVLTATLALVYFGGVALFQGLLRALTGQESQLAQSQLAVVAATLAVAGLFGPLRRRVQALIDRRFYRSKYDAAKTLEVFGAKVRDEVDLQKLTGELVAAIDQTVQPVHVSLWLRPPEREGVEEQLPKISSRS